jgi:hypothetical protein
LPVKKRPLRIWFFLRADEESRAELIDTLRAAADAARSIAGGSQGAKASSGTGPALRGLDRVIDFLEKRSLHSIADQMDQALCEQVRQKLEACGQWR